ncbi:MAG: hypothetical protein WC785_06970 [Tatlockia sp.]|jgi:hypothetical protein
MKGFVIFLVIFGLTACTQARVYQGPAAYNYDPVTPITPDQVNIANTTIDYY